MFSIHLPTLGRECCKNYLLPESSYGMSAIHLHVWYPANVNEGAWAEGKKAIAMGCLLHHWLIGGVGFKHIGCFFAVIILT